jgi:hypothetical protein
MNTDIPHQFLAYEVNIGSSNDEFDGFMRSLSPEHGSNDCKSIPETKYPS